MSEFIDNLHEVFVEFGDIQAKRMFGGYGIYHDGLMFALVADDTLYLKVDAKNRVHFDELDLPAFEFSKQGKRLKMSYRLAPETLFDDPPEAKRWASLAFEAALRSGKK